MPKYDYTDAQVNKITQLDHTRSAHQIYLDLRKINKTNALTLAKINTKLTPQNTS